MNLNKIFRVITAVFVLIWGYGSWGQNSNSPQENALKPDKMYFVPLPALSYNPATGFMYGISGTGSMQLGNVEDTRMSSGLIATTYSSNKQFELLIRSNIYTNKDQWMLMGDWRFLLSSQPTYGLGTGRQSEILLNDDRDGFELGDYKDGVDQAELMEFRLFRFYETVFRQINHGFYLGVGFHFDWYYQIKDDLLDLNADPEIVTNHFAYNQKHKFDPTHYIVSGPSINALYDTRDNINNPYLGRYALLQFRMLPKWLGSSQNATSLWLEYRDYFRLSKEIPRNLLAFWFYSNLTTNGKLPYMGLPAIGWDQLSKSGRAYPQGRFRGENLFYGEIEYRFRLPIRLKIPLINNKKHNMGGVLFTNGISVSAHDLNNKLFSTVKLGAGVGLRFLLSEVTRSNIAFDYGIGANGKGAFYIGLNEYF